MFYAECYLHSDVNADYIYSGVRDGFNIVDNLDGPPYFCTNYKSILCPDVSVRMDKIVSLELASVI